MIPAAARPVMSLFMGGSWSEGLVVLTMSETRWPRTFVKWRMFEALLA
jgi:hypothetical protein